MAGSSWMSVVLWSAAVYNIVWGGAAVCFPQSFFKIAGMTSPNYPELWQCIGMMVGVFGIGYAIASRDPLRHWPIVLVGLVGKVLGPLGFLIFALQGSLPWKFGWVIVTNDLIWWLPFSAILLIAWRTPSKEKGSGALTH